MIGALAVALLLFLDLGFIVCVLTLDGAIKDALAGQVLALLPVTAAILAIGVYEMIIASDTNDHEPN